MRQREYGGVPWYLMFTIVASIGAGYGTYHVLHLRERERAEERARAPAPPPAPPAPKPREEPMPEPEPEPMQPEAPVEAMPTVPVVTIREPLVIGDIESVDIEIRTGAQREAIESCYRNVQAQGQLPISVSIGPTGRATAVKVVGEPFDRGLATCVSAVIKRIRFAAPLNNEPAETTIPIDFKRI